jgi:hypothetical protein
MMGRSCNTCSNLRAAMGDEEGVMQEEGHAAVPQPRRNPVSLHRLR